MKGITADYTTNIGVAQQQMKLATSVDEAIFDKYKQPSVSNHPRGDTVTISDEARAMSAATSRKGGSAGANVRKAQASGASDSTADAIAKLKEKIRKVKEEISELKLKADGDEESKLQLAKKQSELVRLQDRLSQLESKEAAGHR